MNRVRLFLLSVASLLVLTSLAKIISATGEAQVLSRPDPIFSFFTNRQMMLVVGGIELAIAWGVWKKEDLTTGLFLVSWLAASFLVYRAGLWWTGFDGECSCLGTMTENIGLPDQFAKTSLNLMLCYMVGGSILSFCGLYFSQKKILSSNRDVGPA